MKNIDDYTIGELKEIIQQREQKQWSRKKVEFYYSYDFSTTLLEKITLIIHMQSFADYHNDGWKADWCNNDQKKWGISSGRYRFTTDYDYVYNSFLFGISVKSEEIAEAMFEEFGEELEIYLQ